MKDDPFKIYKYGWEVFGFKSYKKYLNSKLGKEKRKIIMEEIRNKWENCGLITTQVHHKTYLNCCNETKDDVLVPCKICNLNLHKRVKNGI